MISKELINLTIQEWQPYTDEPLTEDDAREIIQNTVTLFELLAELDRKYPEEGGDENVHCDCNKHQTNGKPWSTESLRRH